MRFVHRRRFDFAIRLLDVRSDSHVLDFGAGAAYVLEQLLPVVHSGSLTAFEPFAEFRESMQKSLGGAPVEIVAELRELEGRTYDRIACLEVLEHLQPREVERSLATLEHLLSPDGILVISVPLEVGLPALWKYVLVRVFTGSNRHYSVRDVIRALLGRPVSRDTEADFLPHKGFDYRGLRRILRGRFHVERELFSPLPPLRGVLNSQVLWRLRPRSRAG